MSSRTRAAAAKNVINKVPPVGILLAADWRGRRLMGEGEAGQGAEMISAKIVERPARFDRVDRVKEAVGQPVLADDDRFWILGGRLVAQVEVKEWIEIPVGSLPMEHQCRGGRRS